MNEKKNKYEKRFQFQQKTISRQLKQIDDLKLENEKLKLELEEKNKIINSVASLKNELIENVNVVKKYKEEYKGLVDEVRKMKEVVNREVYKGKWRLVRLLIK